MVAPDVEIDDGKGSILLSSEEEETKGIVALRKCWEVYYRQLIS